MTSITYTARALFSIANAARTFNNVVAGSQIDLLALHAEKIACGNLDVPVFIVTSEEIARMVFANGG